MSHDRIIIPCPLSKAIVFMDYSTTEPLQGLDTEKQYIHSLTVITLLILYGYHIVLYGGFIIDAHDWLWVNLLSADLEKS